MLKCRKDCISFQNEVLFRISCGDFSGQQFEWLEDEELTLIATRCKNKRLRIEVEAELKVRTDADGGYGYG